MEDNSTSSGFITGNEFRFSNDFTDIKEFCSFPRGYALLCTANKGGRLFILKGLKPMHQDNPVYIGLLRKEYDISYRLDHPNICKIISFEHIVSVGSCIVMEYVDGLSLREYIREGWIDSALARRMIRDLLDAVAYMHKSGVIHKDIKPENIIVASKGKQLKIIDFGLADNGSYQVVKGGVGTRFYAPPELLEGKEVTAGCDIYSLGMVIQEIAGLKGVKLGGPYRAAARKAVHSRQEDRFSSVEAMQEYIEKKGRWRVLFRYGMVGILLCLLSVVYFYRERSQTINDTVLIQNSEKRDIQEVHYSCYLQIDSIVRNAGRRFHQKATELEIDAPFYNFQDDSVRIHQKLLDVIAREYAGYIDSKEMGNSQLWAQENLKKCIENAKKDYALTWKEKIKSKWGQGEVNPEMLRKKYVENYGQTAIRNLELIDFYTTDDK